jgi:hypothetical protein
VRLLPFAAALLVIGCGSQDAPQSLVDPPLVDAASESSNAAPDGAGKADAGNSGGAAGATEGGAVDAAGKGGGDSGSGTGGGGGTGGAGTGGGGSGGGNAGSGTGGSGASGAAGSAGAADAGLDATTQDAPMRSDVTPDRDGGSLADSPADSGGNVCTPPTPPGPSNTVIDCNSGCGPTTDAPSSACGKVCTDSWNGFPANGPASSDRSILFPAVAQADTCAGCSWAFTVYTPASGTGCVRVTASAGRTVTKYATVDAAVACGAAAATSCAALQHDASNTQAAVVRADVGAPAGWVRVETGACPMACP